MGYDNEYENEPLSELNDIGKDIANEALHYGEKKLSERFGDSKEATSFSSEVNTQPENSATAISSETAKEGFSSAEESASGMAHASETTSSEGANVANTVRLSNEAAAEAAKTATAGAAEAVAVDKGVASAAEAAKTATEAATTATEAATTATEAAGAAATASGASTAANAAKTVATGTTGGPLGLILAGSLLLGKAAGSATGLVDSEDDDKSNSLWGIVIGIILILIIVVGAIIALLFGPLFAIYKFAYGAYTKTVELIDTVDTYFEEQQKIDFFEDLFDSKEVEGEIYLERKTNAEAMEVYKDIIDHSIYLCLKDYSWDLFSFSGSWNFMKQGYSPTITYSRLMKNPYPYALRKDDGTYYTVSEFLKDYETARSQGMDTRVIQNNDLNYAEFFAILMQSNNINFDSFSYSDFYDLLINEKTTARLIELEVGDAVYVKKEGFTTYDDESTLSQEALDGMSEDYETEELTDEPSWWEKLWGGYEVTVYPAGLRELYDITGSSPYDANKIVDGKQNRNLLDYNELWVRKMFPASYLGPSYDIERSTRSPIYHIVYTATNGELIPSGRSSYAYTADSITWNGLNYLQLYSDSIIDLDVTYIPNGSSYVMDMYRYISQLSYDESIKRGKWDGTGDDPRFSIKKHGCIDCCYVMVYEYFYRSQLNVPEICRDYVFDDSFYWGDFMKDYGINNHYEGFPFERTSIQKALTEGRLAIMKFHGHWEYDGVVYKKSSDTDHYLVIMGYDDNGFYVYDPANERSSKYGPIPYPAFYNASGKLVYLFDVPEGCDVHYLINKPADESGDNNG